MNLEYIFPTPSFAQINEGGVTVKQKIEIWQILGDAWATRDGAGVSALQ